MDFEKILENMPDSVLDSIAEKVGVNKGVVSMVIAALSKEMQDGSDWIDLGKQMLDRDGDGQIIDDLGDIAGSFLGKK